MLGGMISFSPDSIVFTRRYRQAVFALLLIVNAMVWVLPSNVAEQFAREQPVLLGRYSRTHVAWLIGMAILTPMILFPAFATSPAMLRRRVFAVFSAAIAATLALLAINVGLYFVTDYPYVAGDYVYHRPPNARYHSVYEDRPEPGQAYPVIRPGFGRVECTLTFDANGYRNRAVPDQCDIVTVGDSFTEGSRVTDGDEWPARLAVLTNQSVYNLGLSGYGLPEYVAAVKAYGLTLKPRIVVCMLYEGNDFRSTTTQAQQGVTWLQVLKASPLLMRLNDALLRGLGPIGSQSAAQRLPMLAWQPMALPEGPAARYYAFAPKQLLELYAEGEEFRGSGAWFASKGLLKELDRACREAGATLVVAYAPSKAHVVFPPAADRLPGNDVLAFCRLRYNKALPPADQICRAIAAGLGRRESVISQWCRQESIPFVSLTSALREACMGGRPCYYTYDQHWSPIGHEIAAKVISASLNKSTLAHVEGR